MAHNEKLITKRITFLDDLGNRHDQSGRRIPTDATIQHDGQHFVVLKEGGTFHLRKVHVSHDNTHVVFALSDSYGSLFRPIAPGTTWDDVEGAVHAHDTGTHWRFAHCTPAEHVDFAFQVDHFAETAFAHDLAWAQIKATEATNDRAKAAAIAKVKALHDFASDVADQARRDVLAAPLGRFHTHDGKWAHSKRGLAAGAISSVLSLWKKNALTDVDFATKLRLVRPLAARIQTYLSANVGVDHRLDIAAREEAAKKKSATPAESEPAHDH